jgi:hypothetical protein
MLGSGKKLVCVPATGDAEPLLAPELGCEARGKNGWGEVKTIEVGAIKRRMVRLTAEEVGLTLAVGKYLLGEFGHPVLQTQMEVYTTCTRVCRDCMKVRRQRDNRSRKVQTPFGAVTVDARRVGARACMNFWSFVDVSSRRSQTCGRTAVCRSSVDYRRN